MAEKVRIQCKKCGGTGTKRQGGPLAIGVPCQDCKEKGYIEVEKAK